MSKLVEILQGGLLSLIALAVAGAALAVSVAVPALVWPHAPPGPPGPQGEPGQGGQDAPVRPALVWGYGEVIQCHEDGHPSEARIRVYWANLGDERAYDILAHYSVYSYFETGAIFHANTTHLGDLVPQATSSVSLQTPIGCGIHGTSVHVEFSWYHETGIYNPDG